MPINSKLCGISFHIVERCQLTGYGSFRNVLMLLASVIHRRDVYKRQVFVSIIYVFSDGVVSSVGYFIIVFPKCVSSFVCVGIVVCECDVFTGLSLIHI